MITEFISAVGSWITGMFGWIVDGIGVVTDIFYTADDGFTMIGLLALFGLAVGMVYFILNFVRGFLQK